MANPTRPERRKARREMHVDRRKSDFDIIEHVVRGVRCDYVRPISDGPNLAPGNPR
jgi:hypothetical protein